MKIPSNTVNEFHSSPAYHAGRLMAVCQHIQDLAAPEVGRTYTDSYFSAACVTPNIVLPRVWKVARTRLRQIKRFGVRKDIEDLANRLINQFEGKWPARLSLHNQSLFQLGFYHQRSILPIPDSRRRILTAAGESVKSYGEKLIADILHESEIKFGYEDELTVPDVSKESGRNVLKPDFTIHSRDMSRHLYVEYCGMRGDAKYDSQWSYKRSRFSKLGARTLEDVETDGKVTEHTMMEVISNDIRDSKSFRTILLSAISLVLEIESPLEQQETPF